MNFVEEYDKLTATEKNTFSDVVNRLLFQCFTLKMKYDRQNNMEKLNYDYSFLEKHYSLVEDYLSYMDVSLEQDEDRGVFYCRSSEGKNHLKIDSATTLLVYALRSYYDRKIEENPNSTKVFMTSANLKIWLRDIGLSTTTKKITAQQLAISLRTLANYNIVLRVEHNFYDPTFSFYILPTIALVINPDKVNALYDKLSGNSNETNYNNENNDIFDNNDIMMEE